MQTMILRSLGVAVLAASLYLPSESRAAALSLDPTLAGEYAAGTGANASFYRIDGSWTGSRVYWNESTGQYSNTPGDGFAPIGSHDNGPGAWGTGLWGLADWRAVQTAANGGTEANAPAINGSWQGTVSTINQGDTQYATDENGAARWGAADPLPTGLFAEGGAEQDNWTAHYTGYIRITDPGDYNFGVLFDDGFFLTIWGADDQWVGIASDFLSSRDRLGFDTDLALGTGLYRFELGVYDRLQVGVANLAWQRGGDSDWTTVPTEHLVTDPIPLLTVSAPPVAVSTPGTAAILLAGLTGLAALRRRRKS
jgi:MYXO-CTERM domain-containing protein